MIELKIYVPKPNQPPEEQGWLSRILPGSGIVGSSQCRGIRIDYEGNRNHACNIKTWEDKVFHAAGRHVTNYPTIARALVTEENVIEVGVFRCEDNWKNPSYEITNPEVLNQWKEAK